MVDLKMLKQCASRKGTVLDASINQNIFGCGVTNSGKEFCSRIEPNRIQSFGFDKVSLNQDFVFGSKKFKVEFDENVTLFTIRHFNDKAAQTVEENKIVLLKQVSRETMQVITKEV